MSVERETLSFISLDGASDINARFWVDSELTPKGVVQLVHGMAEHIDRYDEFARFLASRGFAVCGHDHIGHGGSVEDSSQLGHMPMKGGADILIADVDSLRKVASSRYPGLPYFIFGHSMGSFVTRCYLARHGEGLAGAILCGTGNQPAALSAGGNALCHLIGVIKGSDYRSKLIDSLAAGGFNNAIDNPRTAVDWISHNKENVDAYLADGRCGFMFSAGAYAALTSLTREAVSKACVNAYPKGLPLLYAAGEEDPVGDCGKGVRAAAKLARGAGLDDVQVKLYPHMRHEILNEDDKAQVMEDVASWIEERM